METLSCSEDSFNSIYKCSCSKLLCSRHYFSHRKTFPDHEINRIKIDVNNKSRQILISFVIASKKKLISFLNEGDLEFVARNFENYKNMLIFFHTCIHRLQLLLLFLTKAKYISKKIFYSPVEYFLHQPDYKASKYVNDFIFPKSLKEITKCAWNIFNFNYLKFEDKRYIFDFNYCQCYDNIDIFSICFTIMCEFFLALEYEMGYEAFLNFINLIENINEKCAKFWGQFVPVLYKFIKKRKITKLVKQWKKIDTSLLEEINLSQFYFLSEELFKGLNQKDLAFYFLDKLEISIRDNCEAEDFFCLASLFEEYKNYEKAKIYCKKCVQLFQHSSDFNTLWYTIMSCNTLIRVYRSNKNQIKVNKTINIVNELIKSFGKDAFGEPLLFFYAQTNDLDNALKLAFKLIRLYKRNQTNSLYYNIAYIYLLLSDIYMERGDYKKFLQAVTNAKSCCGILPMADKIFFEIDFKLGWFYLQIGQNENAIEHFENIINYCKDEGGLFLIKIWIGYAYYHINNYDKALQYFIIVEDSLYVIKKNSNQQFFIYIMIGESYRRKNFAERAKYYFCKAYEFINHLEINKPAEGDMFYEIYAYFLNNCDYDKCNVIMQKWSTILEFCSIAYKLILFTKWYDLSLCQNRIDQANIYLDKAEKLLEIETISLSPKNQMSYELIPGLWVIASIYLQHKNDFLKAEKIYKIIESALDIRIPYLSMPLMALFEQFLYIYKQQNRQLDIQDYSQKYLNLLELAGRNEIYRQIMKLSKDDIENKVRNIQEMCQNAYLELSNSIK